MPLKGDGRHLFFAEEQAPLKLPRTGSSDLRISKNSLKLGYPKPWCIAIFLKKCHFVVASFWPANPTQRKNPVLFPMISVCLVE